nr:XS domain-containing protein [Tanacetum cinerariifolium]
FGFTTGKSKSMFDREGHMGTTVVHFANDPSGLKDAMRLADFFEKQKNGRTSWASIQSSFRPRKDDEKEPNFVKLDKRILEKERILYGYLGIVFDLEGVDFDTRKKVTIESKREKAQPHW